MSCLPCSKVKNVDVVKYYKQLYKEKGIETYFFRLKKGGDLKVVRKEQFSIIYKEQIKPNLVNGAEYFNIQEFKAN